MLLLLALLAETRTKAQRLAKASANKPRRSRFDIWEPEEAGVSRQTNELERQLQSLPATSAIVAHNMN